MNETPNDPTTEKKFPNLDQRRLESIRVFHDVARALTSNIELDPLLRSIMGQMEEFFGPEQWSLLMLDEKAGHLFYALSAGVPEGTTTGIRIPLGEGVAGYVAATGNPLVIPHVADDLIWSRYAAQHPELRLDSIACLPIRHGRRTLGVLQLHNSKLDLLPDSSISFLRVMCDYAAIALENARQVKLIHDLSITDDCTGLFNARYMYTLLNDEINELNDLNLKPGLAPERPHHFSLVFLDLDHFKNVNDEFGHLVGSQLLAEIGNLVKRTLTLHNPAFRYGGDEFVSLLRGLDKPEATTLVQKLRNELNNTDFLTAAGMRMRVEASFGLATFPQDGDDLHAIIRAADHMMYTAKGAGRNCVAVCDAPIPPSANMTRVSRHD